MPMLVAEQRVEKWRVLRLLAQGGQGAVYEALRDDIHQRGALKVLLSPRITPALLQRFNNEARAVNSIKHRNIPEVFDFGAFPDGSAWLVMDYVEGVTLEARLGQRRLTLPEVLSIAEDVASALDAAHKKGIVHRDIKPNNIMLAGDDQKPLGERALVLDFGIAKLTEAEPVTATGNLVGTPLYMAYEQGVKAATVDGRADVYSLGVMLFQMLCRRLPFPYHRGDSHLVVLSAKLEPSIPIETYAPNLPPGLRALVNAMVQKDRALRPSMLEVRAALRTLMGLPPVKATGTHEALAPVSAKVSAQDADAGAQAAVNGPLDFDDEGQDPTGGLPGSPGAAPALAGTPSEQQGKGELSPPDLAVPPSVSEIATRPMPLPPPTSGPTDRTAQPAPTLGVPAALASPLAVTEAAPLDGANAADSRSASRRLVALTFVSLAAVSLGVSGLFLWPKKPQPPVAVSATPHAGEPAKNAAAPHVAEPQPKALKAAPTIAEPTTEPAPKKAGSGERSRSRESGSACEPLPLPKTCTIAPALSAPQQDALIRALNDAGTSLCPGESLELGGLPAAPHLTHAPASLGKDRQRLITLTLRGLFRSQQISSQNLPSTVKIKCPRR